MVMHVKVFLQKKIQSRSWVYESYPHSEKYYRFRKLHKKYTTSNEYIYPTNKITSDERW